MGDWHFAINLSGDTFPLISQSQLIDKLWKWRGRNFVSLSGYDPYPPSAVHYSKADRVYTSLNLYF